MEKESEQEHDRHTFTVRKLFGGAMECFLPASFIDVSDLRQVPDHQEVFADRINDVSVIIEVLDFEANLPDDGGGGQSARHFFDDLVSANDASSSACDFSGDLTESIIPNLASFPKAALAGRQMVTKFRGTGPPEAVRVYLVNVRLRNVSTDLLVTVNVPYPDEFSAAKSPGNATCFVEEESESRAESDSSKNKATGESSEARGGPERAPESDPKVDAGDDPGRLAISTLRTLLNSFAILDWSLFG